MSAIDKEKIFVELRKYHLSKFPAKLASQEMVNFRTEFGALEDKIISMILSLVNGKAGFIDASEELEVFKNKIKIRQAGDRLEDTDRNLFAAKIVQLQNVLAIAKGSTFKLRKTRLAKIAPAPAK